MCTLEEVLARTPKFRLTTVNEAEAKTLTIYGAKPTYEYRDAATGERVRVFSWRDGEKLFALHTA